MSSLELMSPPDPIEPTNISTIGSFRNTIHAMLLQIGQRLGVIALFSTLAAWAMLYLAEDATYPLALAAATAETGLASALLGKLILPKTDHREANGIAIFNLVLLGLAIYLMLFLRIGEIHSAATKFFTALPSPPSPPVPVSLPR